MNLWEKYHAKFQENSSRNAFCIGGKTYTYGEFMAYISGSQQLLLQKLAGQTGLPVGVICHDSIETFAAIFAIWFSSCHFVPLNPMHPEMVNQRKIQEANISVVFSSEVVSKEYANNTEVILNKEISCKKPLLVSTEQPIAYVLFTSGSTGTPKGVPISCKNLRAFIEGFLDIYPDLTCNDRFLQTYDLTSDASFTGYLIPFLLGASVFTIPPSAIKYLAIVKLLKEYQITWTQFTPSVLNYLRPYLQSIRFDQLKHSHFGGEALPFNLVDEWFKCVPNAEISNIYGPTETTITCTIFRAEPGKFIDHVYNEQVSIGKPLKNVRILVVDEQGNCVPEGEKGELVIGGPQVMTGYLNQQSTDCFLSAGNELYYKSGDLVVQNAGGFLFFCGRKDEQLKINGYRIEPAEIEKAISLATGGLRSCVYGYKKQNNMEAMVAFIERLSDQPDALKEKLLNFLPQSLIPDKIIRISHFPLNSNGKTDKFQLLHDHKTQLL